MIILGCFLVGLAAIEGEAKSQNKSKQASGIALILLGEVSHACFYVSEEKILAGHQLHPLKIVGTEGMWGFTFTVTFLFIFQLIPCDASSFCSFTRIENSAYAFKQIYMNGWMTLSVCISVVDVTMFNFFGVWITKCFSAASRATVDLCRMFTVSAISLMMGLEEFNGYKIPGFFILCAGFLVYNEILVIPFCRLDRDVNKQGRSG